MGKARHPNKYVEGVKRQVTIPWKKRVLAALAKNEEDNKTPANPGQLMHAVGAKKGYIDRLLKLDTKKPQLVSAYADAITEVLQIDPPLVETEEDDEHFGRDAHEFRTLPHEVRRHLLDLAVHLHIPKKAGQ